MYLTDRPLPPDTEIRLSILRGGNIAINKIRRKFTDLVGYLYRECSFPKDALPMIGTGVVPGSDFTLQSGDETKITSDAIGTLGNTVA